MHLPKTLAVLVLGMSACGGPKGDVVVVADQSLSQDRLLGFMARTSSNASPYDLADAIAEGWLDLALVSEAAARGLAPEDTTLQRDALAPFVRVEHLRRLQNALAVARPPLTDEQIDRAFNGDSLRLFQRVLVNLPDRASPLLISARRARADSILALAQAGAPFDRLAIDLSEGPTAKTGGYLDPVTRDAIPAAFRDSLWALQPGAISAVLPLQQGFEILRRPPLTEVRSRLAAYLLRTAGARADSLFADSLAAAHDLTILRHTADRLRAVLANPDSLAPDSVLIVAFDGGGVTPEEAWLWLATLPDRSRLSLARASDADLEVAARRLARNELLYRAARARGIDAHLDDLGNARGDFVAAADPIFAIFGTASAPRRQELVDSIVGFVLTGRPGPQLPAGLTTALRRRIPHVLDRRALGVVARAARFQPRPDSLATGG